MNDRNDTGEDYSAQTFYDEVAAVLEQTLAQQPQRQDLRFKLLELYAAAGHRDAFRAVAQTYRDNLRQGLAGDWDRVEALGESLLLTDIHGDAEPGAAAGSQGQRFGEAAADSDLGRALAALAADYAAIRAQPSFLDDFDQRLSRLSGRVTPALYRADRLTDTNGGAPLFIARRTETDIASQKLANALLQGLVAIELGREQLVAASRSGLHGLAVAAAAAHLGLRCRLHFREGDAQTDAARLDQAERAGAEVILMRSPRSMRHTSPAAMLNELRNRAVQDWLENPDRRQFVNGLAAGPEPYPGLLRDAHAGPGRALRRGIIAAVRHLPGTIAAPLDQGLEAFNLFVPFLGYSSTRLVAIEDTAPDLAANREQDPYQTPHRTFFSDQQRDAADRIMHAPGHVSTRREHAWLRETGRVDYTRIDDAAAGEAADLAARREGLLLSPRSARALAAALTAGRSGDNSRAVVALVESGLAISRKPG
ncbi:pyridoxal-phosphate dependent enzyme [Salinisphaera sp. P385]|uniref:tryptophan synthase n=1 Tax=Spectribacter acetivorans TaxID=3075603 RepID=A0ABU3B9N1_9GAMM|nr:pyridoxal-phosphate dependent enzyme [Salinisphaera sp. P385]MDT0619182.1 pyridoxal-phosphate dependent enzyme [Salinisphaera sp. P385]